MKSYTRETQWRISRTPLQPQFFTRCRTVGRGCASRAYSLGQLASCRQQTTGFGLLREESRCPFKPGIVTKILAPSGEQGQNISLCRITSPCWTSDCSYKITVWNLVPDVLLPRPRFQEMVIHPLFRVPCILLAMIGLNMTVTPPYPPPDPEETVPSIRLECILKQRLGPLAVKVCQHSKS